MVLEYRKGEQLLTEIFVDFMHNTVSIKNYTDDVLDRAFGVNENPTMKDFEDFIEDRSIPRTRANFKEECYMRGIEDTTPLGIVRFFNGRCEGDDFWIAFRE